jgi:hypothetical protein
MPIGISGDVGYFDSNGSYWLYTEADIKADAFNLLPSTIAFNLSQVKIAQDAKSGGQWSVPILDVDETASYALGESIADIIGSLPDDIAATVNARVEAKYNEGKDSMSIADTFYGTAKKATKTKSVVKKVAYKAPAKKTVAKKTVAKTAMQKKMAKVRAAKKK